ncbi:MAG TPA: hypothetical protein VGM92_10775 [Candidatus Kapabacteria bacterium]|jgi:hypothetical protein
MKKFGPFVLLLALCACSSNHTVARDALGRPQPINVDTAFTDVPDACRDSLFLALQTKPFTQMTAYEHAYFEQKWQECNGPSTPRYGTTPEWIVASLYLIGVIPSVLLLVL